MSTYRAQVHAPFGERHARLLVMSTWPGRNEVLLEDGTWQRIDEGVQIPSNAGIPLPHDALEAIAGALADYLGNALPSQAEVAVLREVLAKEQSRVDDVLGRARI